MQSRWSAPAGNAPHRVGATGRTFAPSATALAGVARLDPDTDVAVNYPASPPSVNQTADVEPHPAVHIRLLGVAQGLWHTDVAGDVQAEIRLESDGRYSVLVTNGKESMLSEWASWREAMIHGLV